MGRGRILPEMKRSGVRLAKYIMSLTTMLSKRVMGHERICPEMRLAK